jgi:hypothetical protein
LLSRLAVFANQSEIDTPSVFAAAFELGGLLAEGGITLISAAAELGPLATVAERARAAGGVVRQLGSAEELREVVGSQADAILALPGAFATIEEAFAVWDDSAGREVPFGLLDLDQYYSTLLRQAGDPAVDRFARESQRGQLILGQDPADLLRRLREYRAPERRRRDSGFSADER